ncbi:ATP-binding protein [Streptomyces nigrescens]|uniref:ATP-binding protein n=1 Tax=Streptomyces nigrescens TaxID=1920 RepID=A0ABY7J0N1_STRNI|nr:ATP-binding protein [Streptomyces nigrescens]WAU04816.1 ATP-binding protein [Streptomyces nigrescens]
MQWFITKKKSGGKVSPQRLPLFLAGQALASFRDSGYSLSAAISEVVDNSLEATARNILVRMDEEPAEGRHGKNRVWRISFADDGSGMDDGALHRYPQVGHSSRYMRTDTIGKYGVGAKLSALNYGRRIDVWSRTSSASDWRHVWFDLDDALAEEELANGQSAGIDPPTSKPVPDDLRDLLPDDAGTLVVWSKIDRLEDGRHSEDFKSLVGEVKKELSRTFRYFIDDGQRIEVNGEQLLAHDPLFLLSGTWAESVLDGYSKSESSQDMGSAFTEENRDAVLIADEPLPVGTHTAQLRVTLYPPAATRSRQMGGDDVARRMRIPDNEGRISFVRRRREISYTNVPRIFGRRVAEPDRFIGIEVAFGPELDAYFGVRHVKRGAEPHAELRDQLRKELKKPLKTARKILAERWQEADRDGRKHLGEHRDVSDVASRKASELPALPVAPRVVTDPVQAFEDLARDVLGPAAQAEEKAEFIARERNRPFILKTVDVPGQEFIDITHLAGQQIVRLNARHRFYQDTWVPLTELVDAKPGTLGAEEIRRRAHRVLDALSLMLLAYARAEAMDPSSDARYGQLRGYWGMFLHTLMSTGKDEK